MVVVVVVGKRVVCLCVGGGGREGGREGLEANARVTNPSGGTLKGEMDLYRWSERG